MSCLILKFWQYLKALIHPLRNSLPPHSQESAVLVRHAYLTFDSYNLNWMSSCSLNVNISCESDDFDSRNHEKRIFLPYLLTYVPAATLYIFLATCNAEFLGLISFRPLDSNGLKSGYISSCLGAKNHMKNTSNRQFFGAMCLFIINSL